MNPLLDHFLVVAVIGGAMAFFAARFLRKRQVGKGCDSGCGCTPAKKKQLSGGPSTLAGEE